MSDGPCGACGRTEVDHDEPEDALCAGYTTDPGDPLPCGHPRGAVVAGACCACEERAVFAVAEREGAYREGYVDAERDVVAFLRQQAEGRALLRATILEDMAREIEEGQHRG